MKIEIKGYEFNVSEYKLKEYIQCLKDCINNLDSSFILDVNEPILLYNVLTSNYFGNRLHFVEDIIFSHSDKGNRWEALKDIAVKDVKWTKERNKKLVFEAYQKFELKPETVEKVKESLLDILETFKEKLVELEDQEKSEKQEKEKRRKRYKFGEFYRKQYPRGGEDGTDGYIDADIINAVTGGTGRFVMRDVFDFGCYNYPKRLEGSGNALNLEKWTEVEKEASIWLAEFGPFHGFRM